MKKLFIGVDPGKSGSIAWCNAMLGRSGSFKNSGTERDIWEGLRDLLDSDPDSCHIVIEKVHAITRNGAPQGACSNFNFGESYGFLRGIIVASGASFEAVMPKTWQKAFGLGGKYDTHVARKNAHKERAQELFPTLKITHANADALLLAAYSARQHNPSHQS